MHELSLATEMVALIEKVAQDNGGRPVRRAHLLLGTMTHAEPETLRFAFEVARGESALVRACELDIERGELEVQCRQWDYAGPVAPELFACPRCDAVGLDIVRGRELRLSHIEVEDQADA